MKLSREQIEQVLLELRHSEANDRLSERLHLVGKPASAGVSPRDVERVRRICNIIAALPDVRPDRVAELVYAVEHGEYEPTDIDVAEKMLGRMMADKLK